MLKIKLSIITINLNNKTGLSKTLHSVFEQTFSEYEYIVIDGDSTDGSAELIKEHSSKFAYYAIEKDNGVYYAMNKGLTKANGEYCLFLNSGDYLFSKDVLEKVFAIDFNQDIVCGNIKFLNGKENKSPEKISFIRTLPHQATFTKTSLLIKNKGYNLEFKIVADYVFSLEAFLKSATYKHLDIIVAFYEGGGLSYNDELINTREKYKIWQKYFPNLVNDFKYMLELEQELSRVYKIPCLKFFMKHIYPFLRRIKRFVKRYITNPRSIQ